MEPRPLTSIVILTLNELEYTRRCVESIQRCTPEPHELVFVDNGSTDGTPEYLRSIAGATVICNDQNRGFGGGCNQGIAASRGERIMLLNNDTVVTNGWLAALHEGLDADPRRGIVGPRSNHVADQQRVEEVDYDVWGLDGLDDFAAGFTAQRRGTGFAMVRVIGFCMLVRRELVEKIGGFDVRFGLGNFEDDDICLRAAVAGYSSWVCNDSFVHHFGSRTFVGAGIEYSSTMRANWQRFQAKWRLAAEPAGEVSSGSYDPRAVLARTSFDPAVHYAPIVALPFDHCSVSFDHRARALLAACDRHDPTATTELLRGALTSWGPNDDVTVVVRIDPRDTTSLATLERLADELGDTRLPDIQLLQLCDDNDEAVVAACDVVLGVPGLRMLAIAGIAQQRGVTVEQLAVASTPAKAA